MGWGWDRMGWDGIEIELKYIAQYAQNKESPPPPKKKETPHLT